MDAEKQIKDSKEAVAKEAQSHWTYPMAIDILLQEKYDKNSTDPNNFSYIIFIDKEGDVDWEYKGVGDRENLSASSSSVVSHAMALEGMPCGRLPDGERVAFKKMIGEALALAFEGDCKGARQTLKSAHAYYNDRTIEISRVWSAIFLLGVGAILGAMILWSGGFSWLTMHTIYRPMVFGMIGAGIAHFKRIVHAQTDGNAGWPIHVLNVSGHLICGMVFGLVGYLLFKSGLCPDVMKNLCDTKEGILVIAFASGLFESFVPSMLSKFVARPGTGEEP